MKTFDTVQEAEQVRDVVRSKYPTAHIMPVFESHVVVNPLPTGQVQVCNPIPAVERYVVVLQHAPGAADVYLSDFQYERPMGRMVPEEDVVQPG